MTTGGRRRPDSRPSRRRCFFASSRVDPLMARTSSAGLCGSRTCTTVSGGSSGELTSVSAAAAAPLAPPPAAGRAAIGATVAVVVLTRLAVAASVGTGRVARRLLGGAVGVVSRRVRTAPAPAVATATATAACRFVAVVYRAAAGQRRPAVGVSGGGFGAVHAEKVVVGRGGSVAAPAGRGNCRALRPAPGGPAARAGRRRGQRPDSVPSPRVSGTRSRCPDQATGSREPASTAAGVAGTAGVPPACRPERRPLRAAGTAPAAHGRPPQARPALSGCAEAGCRRSSHGHWPRYRLFRGCCARCRAYGQSPVRPPGATARNEAARRAEARSVRSPGPQLLPPLMVPPRGKRARAGPQARRPDLVVFLISGAVMARPPRIRRATPAPAAS